jgi:uncharacterized protein
VARTPRSKKQTGERSAIFKRPAPNALTATVLLLLAVSAGLAAWLSYSYEPAVVQVDTPEAVLPIDLSKEGRGQQPPAPVMAAKPASKDAEPKVAHKSQVPAPQADASAGEKPAKQPPSAQTDAGNNMAVKPALEPKPFQRPAATTPSPSPAPSATPSATPSPTPSPSPSPEVAQRPQQPAPRLFPDSNAKGRAGEPAKTARLAPTVGPAPSDMKAPGGGFGKEAGLTPAPDPALIKSTDNGPLPVVAPDGRTPLLVYARPYKATGRPRIAVIVGSLGLSQATTVAAIQQLPGGVTLAFAPYGRNLQEYVNQARAAGHEVLLQVPMEPMDYPSNDPGPHTLLTSLTINHNLKRLDWLLGRFAGYVGVVNFMGGRFTAAESHIRPILAALRDRGLMFLDARASSSSVANSVAGKIGLTVAVNDRVVDAIASRAAIDARLLELERLASASGGAIGIGFPYPVTIERLAQWTRVMGDRGYDLVPISALGDYQEAKP